MSNETPASFEVSTVEKALTGAAEQHRMADILRERSHELAVAQANVRSLDEQIKNRDALIEKQALTLNNAHKALHNAQGLLGAMRSQNQTLASKLLRARARITHVQAKWYFRLFASRHCKKFLRDGHLDL